jgi:hypothetical protein
MWVAGTCVGVLEADGAKERHDVFLSPTVTLMVLRSRYSTELLSSV